MEKKLNQIHDKRDKRQGSVIFDALAPNSAETATFYMDLAMLENRTYADTATGFDLTKRCAERGVFRKPATKAVFVGKFFDGDGNGIYIPIGSRFHLEELNYVVIEQRKELGEYLLQCETEGIKGNDYLGKLIPVEYIEGLAEAVLTELLTDGEDEENDEELRKRYFESFHSESFGGNIADYRRKVSALDGVGGVKVYPVWNGGGTVKLVILDSGYRKPSSMEISILQQKIDPQKRGLGEGIAPVGHQVTVEPVEEVTCNIHMNVILKEGASLLQVKKQINMTFEEYFLELRQKWEESNGLIVRISYLEARVLQIQGVVDVLNTTINKNSKNYILEETQIPILGNLEVVE